MGHGKYIHMGLWGIRRQCFFDEIRRQCWEDLVIVLHQCCIHVLSVQHLSCMDLVLPLNMIKILCSESVHHWARNWSYFTRQRHYPRGRFARLVSMPPWHARHHHCSKNHKHVTLPRRPHHQIQHCCCSSQQCHNQWANQQVLLHGLAQHKIGTQAQLKICLAISYYRAHLLSLDTSVLARTLSVHCWSPPSSVYSTSRAKTKCEWEGSHISQRNKEFNMNTKWVVVPDHV